MAFIEHRPGERAHVPGEYQELNIFGAPTGRVVHMMEGDELPAAPRGFTWRTLSQRSVTELRTQAEAYRRMAETATTTSVRTALQRISERFDALADQREREENGPAE
jgi:hypothetical protein